MTSTETRTRTYHMGTTPSRQEAESLAALLIEAGIPCRAVHGLIAVGVEDMEPSAASWVEIPDCDPERGLKLWVGVLVGREHAVDVRFGAAVFASDDGHNFFAPQSTVGKAEVRAWLLACLRDALTEDVRSTAYYHRFCAANGIPIRCYAVTWTGSYWANASLYTRRLDVAERLHAMPVAPFGQPNIARRIPQGVTPQDWCGDLEAVLEVG